ncbi:MAG: hypothetical protein ACP5JE_02735, partial [Thermoplasmata archaeon]
RQQLYYQMASEGMLSETTFLRELGKNFKAEQEQRAKDMVYKRKAFIEMSKTNAEGQAAGNEIAQTGELMSRAKAEALAAALNANVEDIQYTPPYLTNFLELLAQAKPDERKTVLKLIKNSSPIYYEEIMKLLNKGSNDKLDDTASKPLPEQKPPRRKTWMK